MGCDIHAMVERRVVSHWNPETYYWTNSGNPGISRNYMLFAILAGVRKYTAEFPTISDPRGVPVDSVEEFMEMLQFRNKIDLSKYPVGYVFEVEDYRDRACEEYLNEVISWHGDGHSHSYVTLKELKEYDIDIEGEEKVGWGESAVVETFSIRKYVREEWESLIKYMEKMKDEGMGDEDVRLMFFFDN